MFWHWAILVPIKYLLSRACIHVLMLAQVGKHELLIYGSGDFKVGLVPMSVKWRTSS